MYGVHARDRVGTDIITYDLDKALLGGVGAKLHSKQPHAVLRERVDADMPREVGESGDLLQ